MITVHDEYASLQPAEFQKEIERLKGLSQKKQLPPDEAKTHIRLAFLYANYRNPLPDYDKALEHLRIYSLLDPEGSRQDHVQNWNGMLREISNLHIANRDLREKKVKLQDEVARIEKENTGMKEKIEKLKYLDIELEQKRKLVQ